MVGINMGNEFWTDSDRYEPINNQVCFDHAYTKILENGRVFHRIVAIKDFEAKYRDIKKGQIGGWFEKCPNQVFYLNNSWIDYGSLVECDTNLSNSYIGKDVIIRSGADIKNCRIADGVRIINSKKLSYLFNSTIVGKMFIDDDVVKDSNIENRTDEYKNFHISSCWITNSTIILFRNKNVRLSKCIMDDIMYDNLNTTGKLTEEDLIATKGQKLISQNIYGDYDNNIVKSLYSQTGLMPINHKVYAYKTVNKDMSSIYDENFIYKVGEVMKANNICEDEDESCGGGLHFSIANYFREYEPSSFTTLYAEIDVDDIITVCKGKIRCRKAKIIGICDDEI